MNSELLPQADVIVAIEPRPQSGEEGQMAPELCAMLVVYVSTKQHQAGGLLYWLTLHLDYAKLTRKMGGKQAMTHSNLRPKSVDHGSPTM